MPMLKKEKLARVASGCRCRWEWHVVVVVVVVFGSGKWLSLPVCSLVLVGYSLAHQQVPWGTGRLLLLLLSRAPAGATGRAASAGRESSHATDYESMRARTMSPCVHVHGR